MRDRGYWCVLVTAAVIAGLEFTAPTLTAQTPVPAGRLEMVPVLGHSMRVRTAGLAERRPGQPILVLEGGAVQSIDTWDPIFDRLAAMAPVVAYAGSSRTRHPSRHHRYPDQTPAGVGVIVPGRPVRRHSPRRAQRPSRQRRSGDIGDSPHPYDGNGEIAICRRSSLPRSCSRCRDTSPLADRDTAAAYARPSRARHVRRPLHAALHCARPSGASR